MEEKYVGLLSLEFPYLSNGNIYWMAILRDYQNLGLGKKLIEVASIYAQEKKAETLTIETLALKEADENYFKTYKFYEACGFKPLFNLKPQNYKWNMVYMVKDLNNKNPLQTLILLEKDAQGYGFDWPNHEMILEQAIDECREIKEAIDDDEPPERVQEEIGDLLHTAISLCIFSGFDVEETLSKTNEKFEKRMKAIKMLTEKHNLPNLQGQSVEFMLKLWKEAKEITKKR
nr:GNAT family N-acetyltransferase [Rickettsia hoogstraalii]